MLNMISTVATQMIILCAETLYDWRTLLFTSEHVKIDKRLLVPD